MPVGVKSHAILMDKVVLLINVIVQLTTLIEPPLIHYDFRQFREQKSRMGKGQKQV